MSRSLCLVLLLLGSTPTLADDSAVRRILWKGQAGAEALDYAANGSFQRYRVVDERTRQQVGPALSDAASLLRESPALHARWTEVTRPIRAAIAVLRQGAPSDELERASAALVAAAFPAEAKDDLGGYLLVLHLLHTEAAATNDTDFLRRVTAALARIATVEQERVRSALLGFLDDMWRDPGPGITSCLLTLTRGEVSCFQRGEQRVAVLRLEREVIVRAGTGAGVEERCFADAEAFRVALPELHAAWQAARASYAGH